MLEVVHLKTLTGNLVWLSAAAVAQVMRVPEGPCSECGGQGKKLAQGIHPVTGQTFIAEAPCSHCDGKKEVEACWGVVMLNGIVHPVERKWAARVVRAMRRLGLPPGDDEDPNWWKRGRKK